MLGYEEVWARRWRAGPVFLCPFLTRNGQKENAVNLVDVLKYVLRAATPNRGIRPCAQNDSCGGASRESRPAAGGGRRRGCFPAAARLAGGAFASPANRFAARWKPSTRKDNVPWRVVGDGAHDVPKTLDTDPGRNSILPLHIRPNAIKID